MQQYIYNHTFFVFKCIIKHCSERKKITLIIINKSFANYERVIKDYIEIKLNTEIALRLSNVNKFVYALFFFLKVYYYRCKKLKTHKRFFFAKIIKLSEGVNLIFTLEWSKWHYLFNNCASNGEQ